MNADLEKLLGAFATDTLTEEERTRLFTAALADQQLFNVLADEQALKELLADPEVRRRVLQSLRQPKPSASGATLSWFDWAVRPATLGIAGGLSAAVLALVLGIRISQDSVMTASRQPVTEDAPSMATPPSPMIQPTPAAPPKQAGSSDAPATPSPPRRHSQAPAMPSGEQHQAERQKKNAAPSSPEKRDVEPPAPAQVPAVPATAPGAMSSVPSASARALFYAGRSRRSDQLSTTSNRERDARTSGAFTPQAARPERNIDPLTTRDKTAEASALPKPLGLRYSFVLQETNGSQREVDAATASHSSGLVSLTVETNQDAYVQIWRIEPSSDPELLFPETLTDQMSFTIMEGHRHFIPLSAEARTAGLTALVSRAPLGPLSAQEASLLEAAAPNQTQESITSEGTSDSREHATYVVNQNSAESARVSVSVLRGR